MQDNILKDGIVGEINYNEVINMKIRLTSDEEQRQTIQQALQENDDYCPCRLQKTPDTKCMCKEFREQESGEKTLGKPSGALS